MAYTSSSQKLKSDNTYYNKKHFKNSNKTQTSNISKNIHCNKIINTNSSNSK